MKFLHRNLLFLLVVLALAGCRSNIREQTVQGLAIPEIRIIYPEGGTPFDWNCCDAYAPVNNEWINEASKRREEFQELWNKDGVLYMDIALREIQHSFPHPMMVATLSVCYPNSVSVPLIMSVKRFMSGHEKPWPTFAFAQVLFHETMHNYIVDIDENNLLNSYGLLQKYKDELPVTKNHLHLMALEKLVLLRSGKTDVLEWLDEDYSNSSAPTYARAWEIVNEIESYEAFIAELKQAVAERSGVIGSRVALP